MCTLLRNVFFIEQLKHSLWSIKYTRPVKCTLQHLKYTFPFDLAHAKFYNATLFFGLWSLCIPYTWLWRKNGGTKRYKGTQALQLLWLVKRHISTLISVEEYKILKFHNYLMEGFRIDLKTFLGLAMPNQCCPTVRI